MRAAHSHFQFTDGQRVMPVCFITQPIHPKAVAFLKEKGVQIRFASAPTMEATIAEVGNAEAVITRDLGFSGAALDAAPKLRIIACHGSGTNRIAVNEAAQRGILVTRAINANSRSVAEMTIALMLAGARKICAADTAVRAGNWDFRYEDPGMEVHGKTLGLVGFGAIARHVAQIARDGLGMKVMAWSPSVPHDVFVEHQVTNVSDLPDLLHEADVVSLHRPADASGKPTLTCEMLGMLKDGSVVVNTSRGSAIDTRALQDSLRRGRLGAALLDVLPQEPPESDDPLLKDRNVVLTPHIGATTEEALTRMAMTCAHQVMACLTGQSPQYVVQPSIPVKS